MAKVKTTVYVDERVLREIRVAAARQGRPVSELVEEALRKSTLSGLLESIRSRSTLSEEEALELAYSELRAMRRERDQPAA
jgi:TPP-dependent indolepyruvate ferredoxin oxidoreductase alpha subunit